GVGVLLELERLGPAVLDRLAEPVQRPHAGVSAPREDELGRAPGADQLVVDHVGGEPDQRQTAAALADQLMAGRVRDEVGEALERDRVAVRDQLGDPLLQRDDLGHQMVCSGFPVMSWAGSNRAAQGRRERSYWAEIWARPRSSPARTRWTAV